MTPRRIGAVALAAALLLAVYGPAPRAVQSEAEARHEALVALVGEVRSGREPDNRRGIRLGVRQLCAKAAGTFGVADSRSITEAWNAQRERYEAQDPVGCNYDLTPMVLEVFDRDGRLGFYFGEDGVGPRWTVERPQAKTVADWRSLLPALVAVLIAVGFRLVIPGLMIGIFVGAMVAADGAVGATFAALGSALGSAFSSSWNGWILVFTFALIAMVSVTEASGGIAGIIRRLTARVKNRRDAETATVALGGMLFFDDYANTMVVGSTMRPITDRYGTSRAKLAYLVDSTAAPLAGIALLSTWIGYEVGLLQDLSKTLELGVDGYGLFLGAVPFRAYCLLALLLVFSSARSGRDLGPMVEAQAAGASEGEPEASIESNVSPASWRALLPLGLTFGLVFAGLLAKGAQGLGADFDPYSFAGWRALMGVEEAVFFGLTIDIASLLALSALVGLIVAMAAGLQAGVKPARLGAVIARGLRGVSPAVAILLCAWVLSAINDQVGTRDVLAGMISGETAAAWLPALTFLLAAGTSFATGTSFGTMGILLPTLVPIAHAAGGLDATVLAVAAVMDGAIFGDHCSPLSDTTVMSSISSGCALDEHVRTQLPYALLAMAAALLCCYIPAGLGWFGPAVALPVGGAVVVGALWIFGRRAPEPEATP